MMDDCVATGKDIGVGVDICHNYHAGILVHPGDHVCKASNRLALLHTLVMLARHSLSLTKLAVPAAATSSHGAPLSTCAPVRAALICRRVVHLQQMIHQYPVVALKRLACCCRFGLLSSQVRSAVLCLTMLQLP